MTDDTPASIAAARALVAAYDALTSEEHEAEAERLRQLSQSVSARVEAYKEAQARLQSVHMAAVAQGEAKPAPNLQAEAVISRVDEDDIELVDLTSIYPGEAEDEYGTSRISNGLHTGD